MKAFLADIDRYRVTKDRSGLMLVLFTQGLWACAIYRLFHPLIYHRSRWIRKLSHSVSLVAVKWIEIVSGISLPPQCNIGPGLHISHFGGIIINPRAKIGANCNLGHGVTIGAGGRSFENGKLVDGVPEIGDRVYIGPGACLIGAIFIADDVAIGANAVVTHSLPERSVAAGVPARIISYKGSFDYINYRSMEFDAKRLASLQNIDKRVFD